MPEQLQKVLLHPLLLTTTNNFGTKIMTIDFSSFPIISMNLAKNIESPDSRMKSCFALESKWVGFVQIHSISFRSLRQTARGLKRMSYIHYTVFHR